MSFFKTVALAIVGALLFVWLLPRANRGGLPPGRKAPPIVAEGWLNGPPPDADFLAGEVYVVVAWGSWCLPCREEAPRLVAVHERFRNRGVQFIGLTIEDGSRLPQMKNYIQETGVPWPCGYGAFDTLAALEAEYVPSLWVIGRNGTIVWNSDSPESLAEAIEAALRAR